ncbi:MAG: Spy/CpxP family protein refolding chaperone [Vicinamibacteria bacterium]|nr:Spy/CpxP family protein refolding chaperone [Vicinamibacteria bacterium]
MRNILMLIGAITMAGTAIAAERERPRQRYGDEALKLTADQRARIDTMRIDHRKAEIRRQADLRVARIELQELLAAAEIDEKAVRTRIRQVADLQTAAFEARMENRLAVSKVLTPEQRAQKGRRGFRDHEPPMGCRFMKAQRRHGRPGPIDAGPIETEKPQSDKRE